MNYLSLDWGEKKIGFAIGSNEVKVASPLFTFRYNKLEEVILKVSHLIESEDIKELVVGRPVKMSGQENLPASYQNFIVELNTLELPIHSIDERLSSKSAQIMQRDFKVKGDDDDLAATVILQTFLDSL